MKNLEKRYDVAVIGGGPGGYSAAIRAAQLGAKVAVFEKDTLGGTCLNVGCLPTKCLLEKAALVEKIRKNTQNGIFKEAGLFSWKKIQEHKDSTVKRLTAGVGGILASYGIEVIKGTAKLKKVGCILVDSNEYEAKKIIIATGSKVFIPPIKGVDGKNVITSTGALSLTKIPKSLVIIGGGVIGLEFASIYRSFGSEITVVEMMDDIVAGEDKEIIKLLKGELVKRGIVFLTSAKVEQIEDKDNQKAVSYTKDGKSAVCKGEYVLVSVGRLPNTEGIELSGLDKDSNGNIKVNNRLETSIPDIYAVGDAVGGFQLAHAAYAEAETAASNCMGGNEEVELHIMPRCIYSMPQFAAVGKTEEQLKADGIEYLKSSLPYTTNGKALASDENFGVVKVLSKRSDGVVLGVHIVGGYATELLSGALAAINKGATVSDFEKMIFPHPTMSELIKEAVLATEDKAIHTPRAKLKRA